MAIPMAACMVSQQLTANYWLSRSQENVCRSVVPIIDIVVIRDQLSIKLVNSSYSTLIIQTHIIITWPPCAMAVAYRAWTFTMATLKWPRPIRPISSVRNCRPTGERTNHCRLHSRYAFFTPFDLTMPEIPAVCLSRSVSCLELVFHFFISKLCVYTLFCAAVWSSTSESCVWKSKLWFMF